MVTNLSLLAAIRHYRMMQVVAAMRSNPTDAGVTRALEELWELAKDNEIRRQLGEAGVCEVVVAAMRRLSTDACVMGQALHVNNGVGVGVDSGAGVVVGILTTAWQATK